MKLDCYLSPYIKIKTKWIKDLNIRSETIKYIEENIGIKLMDLGLRGGFKNSISKAREIKTKINELDYIKLKNFCKGKDIVNKTKRQPME